MWKFLLICVVMSGLYNESDAAGTRKVVRRRRGYAGSYAGGYAGDGGAGGYTGGYNDYDDYGGGYTPYFGGITDPYLFHQQLTNQILAQNYATQQAITGLATSGDASVHADATISDDDTRIQQQIAANSHRVGTGGGGGGAYNSHRYAPSYAAASGSIGPNGHRQTAFINPANPAQPNIVNRFGGGNGGGGGGGYKGVSVSSFSTSNGDGTSRRGAQTTVNDNGKVTTYSVHS